MYSAQYLVSVCSEHYADLHDYSEQLLSTSQHSQRLLRCFRHMVSDCSKQNAELHGFDERLLRVQTCTVLESRFAQTCSEVAEKLIGFLDAHEQAIDGSGRHAELH